MLMASAARTRRSIGCTTRLAVRAASSEASTKASSATPSTSSRVFRSCAKAASPGTPTTML